MDRSEKLSELLEKMMKYIEPTDEEIDGLIDGFKQVYDDVSFRHSYYEISRQIEGFQSDARDNMCGVLEQVMRRLDADEQSSLSRGMIKLYDHIELETLRLGRMDKVNYLSTKAENTLNQAQNLNNESNEKAQKLEKRVDGFHEQSITILGIFSGIVLGFAAEIKLLGESLAHMEDVHMKNMLLYLFVIGFLTFNTLFMLMYAVSKIANQSIAVSCRNCDCEKCIEKHGVFRRLKIKYPYVLIFDVITIIGMIAIAGSSLLMRWLT